MAEISIQLEHLGVLPRLGLKGPGINAWLADQAIELPTNTFDGIRHADGTLIVRLGSSEFMLESAATTGLVSLLAVRLSPLPLGVYQIPHNEVTLLLSGSEATLVFAQTCGIDFRNVAAQRAIYSRVAGVSCGILPESADGSRYRLWVDYGFAPYLWNTLCEIATELGGTIVGSRRAPQSKALAAHLRTTDIATGMDG